MIHKSSKFNIEEKKTQLENKIMEGISFKETWNYEQGFLRSINILTICIFSSGKLNLEKMQICFCVLHLSYIIDHKFKRFVAFQMLISFSSPGLSSGIEG